MIHSFRTLAHANGNLTIEFYENNKRRQIIFTKSTDALINICLALNKYNNDAEQAVKSLKEIYFFKANANNPSIFRPIEKSLILNIQIN